MTADPDAIGPGGTVRLRRYLRHESNLPEKASNLTGLAPARQFDLSR